MSWPYVAAHWKIRLTHVRKHVLGALADQADTAGVVSASVHHLAVMTGMSDRTVQRALEQLGQLGFVRIIQPGTPVACHRYRLTIPGVRLSPGVSVTPGVSDGADGCQAVGSLYPVLDPYKQKKQAEAARRLETPTRDQVTKLVHVLLEDPQVEIRDETDVYELLKSACARAGFYYDNEIINDGISRALAARGQNPKLPWNIQRLRQRSAQR